MLYSQAPPCCSYKRHQCSTVFKTTISKKRDRKVKARSRDEGAGRAPQVLLLGQSSFLVRRQWSMVTKTPTQTMTSTMVMMEPKSRRPLLSKILPMTWVAVTWMKVSMPRRREVKDGGRVWALIVPVPC